MNKVKVGILGSTGIIGQRLTQLLSEHPWFKINALIASPKNEYKIYKDCIISNQNCNIPTKIMDFQLKSIYSNDLDVDIIFSAVPENIASKLEPMLAKKGYVISSNSCNMRLDEDIPLVIPEINPEDIKLIDIQKKKEIGMDIL